MWYFVGTSSQLTFAIERHSGCSSNNLQELLVSETIDIELKYSAVQFSRSSPSTLNLNIQRFNFELVVRFSPEISSDLAHSPFWFWATIAAEIKRLLHQLDDIEGTTMLFTCGHCPLDNINICFNLITSRNKKFILCQLKQAIIPNITIIPLYAWFFRLMLCLELFLRLCNTSKLCLSR